MMKPTNEQIQQYRERLEALESRCKFNYDPRELSSLRTIIALHDENLKETALVMANARRIIKAKVRTSNARLFCELFGSGFGTATQWCLRLGLNPSGNETNYTEIMSHLRITGALSNDN